MGCCGLLKSSKKHKTKSKIAPQPLAPRPVQQVNPGTYSYVPQNQSQQYQAYQPQAQYQAYQPQSQYQPQAQYQQQGYNNYNTGAGGGGSNFDPKKAANAAMARQAGALAGTAFNHATGNKYKTAVDKGTDFAVKKYVASQEKQYLQQGQQQQQQYGGVY